MNEVKSKGETTTKQQKQRRKQATKRSETPPHFSGAGRKRTRTRKEGTGKQASQQASLKSKKGRLCAAAVRRRLRLCLVCVCLVRAGGGRSKKGFHPLAPFPCRPALCLFRNRERRRKKRKDREKKRQDQKKTQTTRTKNSINERGSVALGSRFVYSFSILTQTTKPPPSPDGLVRPFLKISPLHFINFFLFPSLSLMFLFCPRDGGLGFRLSSKPCLVVLLFSFAKKAPSRCPFLLPPLLEIAAAARAAVCRHRRRRCCCCCCCCLLFSCQGLPSCLFSITQGVSLSSILLLSAPFMRVCVVLQKELLALSPWIHQKVQKI